MKYDKELIEKLGNEMFELWWQCKTKLEQINEIIKQLEKQS